MESPERDRHNGEDSVGGRGPRVVVVGAGLAGVAAVGALRAGGIRDVTLLEAQDRPGGRVQTVFLDDGRFVELGAQFLHGKSDVFDIAEREGMLLDDDSDNDPVPDTLLQFRDFIFQTSHGVTVDAGTATHNIQVLEGLVTAANEAAKRDAVCDVNVSVGEFFRSKYNTSKAAMIGTEDVKTAMFRWMEHWECQDTGGSVDQLSLPGIGQYEFCPGNGTRETSLGMEAVFQRLLRDSVPPQSLRLNKAVKAIRWSPNRGQPFDTANGHSSWSDVDEAALGQTTDKHCAHNSLIARNTSEQESTEPSDPGTGNGDNTNVSAGNTQNRINSREGGKPTENIQTIPEQTVPKVDNGHTLHFDGTVKSDFDVRIECEDGDVFYADHVIVTSSIGFLRSNPDFFQPPLTPQHRAAIGSMGFGNVSKMFLLWETWEESAGQSNAPSGDAAADWQRRMFGSDVEGMIPLWLDGVQAEVKAATSSLRTSNGRQWFEDMSHFHVIQSHEFCVIAWVAGEAAVIMESLPVAEVKDVMHELLALFLGKPDLPPPSRLVRSEWQNNPYIRGAYSYLATGVPLELHDMLRQPLPSIHKPVVQLAGEACSKHFYSTLHGALHTGQDAARAILRHHGLTKL